MRIRPFIGKPNEFFRFSIFSHLTTKLIQSKLNFFTIFTRFKTNLVGSWKVSLKNGNFDSERPTFGSNIFSRSHEQVERRHALVSLMVKVYTYINLTRGSSCPCKKSKNFWNFVKKITQNRFSQLVTWLLRSHISGGRMPWHKTSFGYMTKKNHWPREHPYS